MKKLLRIDSSVRTKNSHSSNLTDIFCNRWKDTNRSSHVTIRHVGTSPPSHPSNEYTIANYTPPEERDDNMKKSLIESDTLIKELFDHDEFIFAIPMYNFCIPSTFKAYIDNIVRVGMTFDIDQQGNFMGKLGDKKLTVISSRGARYSAPSPLEPYDMLTPYIKIVMGFIGITDITFIYAEDLDFSGTEIRDSQLTRAAEQIHSLF